MQSFPKLVILFLTFSSLSLFPDAKDAYSQVQTGADQTESYLPMLKGKKVGIVANQTSRIGNVHLVDSLLSLGVDVVRVYGPEHGFRGNNDDGLAISDTIDAKTGLPVISLYGKRRKPDSVDMTGIDLMIFDIQDVGVRFYTFISTLQYVMEACAENQIDLLVLDRPNPNGFYVDGPVLDTNYRSFVGMQPIPVVYGMTMAEYARMLNGEGWLKNGEKCKLQYVLCKKWDHRKFYELPVIPSPNLPNIEAVYLYPSLCFFEGTVMSVGRGTDFPFQIYGHPDYPQGQYSFTPVSIPGTATHPKYEGKLCNGVNLTHVPKGFLRNNRRVIMQWAVDAYEEMGKKEDFFNNYFDKLAGTDKIRKEILAGRSAIVIQASWKKEVQAFKKIRKKYLLYRDFE